MTQQREPSVASFLAGDGWGGLLDIDKRIAANADAAEKRRLEVADAVLALFESLEGQAVLEYLLDRTLRRDQVPRLDKQNLLVTFEQLAPYATFRAGQNAVVADLLELMRAAQARRDKR